MLFFGVLIDRIGRRTGVIAATIILILGIALATHCFAWQVAAWVRLANMKMKIG